MTVTVQLHAAHCRTPLHTAAHHCTLPHAAARHHTPNLSPKPMLIAIAATAQTFVFDSGGGWGRLMVVVALNGCCVGQQ